MRTVAGSDLTEGRFASILGAAESALERSGNGAGEAEFALEAPLLTGSRPSQRARSQRRSDLPDAATDSGEQRHRCVAIRTCYGRSGPE